MLQGSYPYSRLRRLRSAEWMRDLIQENSLSASDFIWPAFLCEEDGARAISALPDVRRYSISELVEEAKKLQALGLRALMLFPVCSPSKKTEDGAEAFRADNLMNRAIRALKKTVPDLGIFADVALDPYTSHGQDGIVNEKGYVVNDATIQMLVKQALSQAEAGVDVVAPSDMMDGRIGLIREALDKAGFEHVQICSYAAKYASSFYGPFRDAVGSASFLKKADKKTYQMNPANKDEAFREVFQDIEEGADSLIIKPGLLYLDVISELKNHVALPLFAYQVSGEYAMLKHAGEKGSFDYQAAMIESLIAFKRAGAKAIISYATPEVLAWLVK